MSYTCPRCQMVSHSPEDEKYGYCGMCHAFTAGISPHPAKPPENVRVLWSDGKEEIVDTMYLGVDPETGTHLWRAILKRQAEPGLQPTGLHADVLPGRTSVDVLWEPV